MKLLQKYETKNNWQTKKPKGKMETKERTE
jgi:hypothetical protein